MWAASFQHDGNTVKQLQSPIAVVEGIAARYTRRSLSGIILRPTDNPDDEILVVDRRTVPPANFARVIQSTTPPDANAAELNCDDGTWLKHPTQRIVTRLSDLDGLATQALNSWADGFRYVKEDIAKGVRGLRNPQIGALHAVLAHWSVSNDVGTIVMPTGTGKTETMLALLLAVPCHRLLVVVPTDALRTQIAEKFFSLGILKTTNVADAATLYPVVAVLRHRPATPAHVDALFERCNVIVTTSQIAGQCAEEVRADSHTSATFYLSTRRITSKRGHGGLLRSLLRQKKLCSSLLRPSEMMTKSSKAKSSTSTLSEKPSRKTTSVPFILSQS